MRGALYLALERGAFDEQPGEETAPPAQDYAPPAHVALYEAAAHHDGQPAGDWLRVFMREWNAGVTE